MGSGWNVPCWARQVSAQTDVTRTNADAANILMRRADSVLCDWSDIQAISTQSVAVDLQFVVMPIESVARDSDDPDSGTGRDSEMVVPVHLTIG